VTSDPDFNVTTFFELEYPICALKDEVTIAQEETIPNIWSATVW